MNSLVFNHQIHHFDTQKSLKTLIFTNPLNKNPIFFKKWVFFHPTSIQTLCSVSATSSDLSIFNGWDDPRLGGGSAEMSESTRFKNLLYALGIDQKRYLFVYILGFICALAVSRIRVSSIVVFPAFVIVFAAGFSIGFVNGGKFEESGVRGSERLNLESVKGNVEKLGDLVEFFDGFVSKVSSLKISIRRRIENKSVTLDDLGNYVEVIESIGLSSLNGKSVVQKCIDSMLIGNEEMEKVLSRKSSKKRREVGDLLKFVGSLFREKSVDLKVGKIKEGSKKVAMSSEVNDQSRENILESKDRGGFGNESEFSTNNYYDPNDVKFRDVSSESDYRSERFSYQGNRVRYVNSQKINVKMGARNEVETWASSDNFLDSVDFRVDSKNMESETFGEQEQTGGEIEGKHWARQRWDGRGEGDEAQSGEDERMSFDNEPNMVNYPYESKTDNDSFPSLSVSNDILFNEYLMEAHALVKQAREYLRVKSDERKIESLLYEAARLFSKAIEMKPMSLLGVGQLGNTYLLHGELKLKKSRRLRAILIENDEISSKRRGRVLQEIDDQFERRDRIASTLIRVCEECEDLLVKAGKKYRLALSIDGNDMRAMYNWGLALSFRAQLIADIGPEAAFDADKVFLAAIEKFDAMMSKTNAYAPDALYRWGVTLQQRSRLRPRNKNEKVKLLQQAKRLYEDALDMDSDNMQVKEALGSCISELDFRNY